MIASSSPHPRLRIYTTLGHYWLPLSAPLRRFDTERETERFEHLVQQRLSTPNALCVPRARTAVYLAVRALVPAGKEVILSPLTIADVVSLVAAAGAIPVFADVSRDGWHIDPDDVENLIGPRTGAVLITHLFGQTAGARRVEEICRNRGVPLIEDAAQAFGAAENGRPLGTWGNLGVFSFGMYKHLNGWRGGMLVSPSRPLLNRIRTEVRRMPILSWGRLAGLAALGLTTDLATLPPLFSRLTFPVFRWAQATNLSLLNRLVDPEFGVRRLDAVPRSYRARMNAAQVRLAGLGLERLEEENQIRRRNADLYLAGLCDLEELTLPAFRADSSPVFPYFPIRCRDRSELLQWLLRQRRDVATHSLKNCADLPAFQAFHCDCPNARCASRSLVLLPNYPRYPVSEIHRNIAAIRAFFRYDQTRQSHAQECVAHAR
ncbi:MAG: DegT/DnrJ/EryC1/StrS family aminotransferase [Acidobacteriota bacterium]